MKLTILSASFHRNGVCGEGFYSVIFNDEENGKMHASLFDKAGYCAVHKIEELAKDNIDFARGNSWRGDRFESELRPLLNEFFESKGTNRIGPFSI